jgi:hypothetical protein
MPIFVAQKTRMAKQQAIEKDLANLRTFLANYPEGISVDQLRSHYDKLLTERTLQRRLSALLQQGIIRNTGRGLSLVYYLVSSAEKPAEEQLSASVPLSAEGLAIQRLVQKPEGNRIPVGYYPDFLLDYAPNTSAYFTKAEREKLMTLGKTNQLDQPAGTYARKIMERLLIDLAWNSSRLEGNTYSLLDTKRLLSEDEPADNKTVAETQMILNHKEAIEFIVESAAEIGFNRYTITNLHALLSNNLLADPGAPGRLRTFAVGIQRSVYTPLAIPQKIEELFDTLLQKAAAIEDPFEQAFFVMVQLPYLQPFDDVNKRVSRLAANIPLNKHNLAPLSFVDVPQDLYIQGLLGIYELRRVNLLKDVFLWAYERSSLRYSAMRQSIGDPDPFRVRYRSDIRDLVSAVVTQTLTQLQARKVIADHANRLPEADRTKFEEVVEGELLGLHAGNIARYRIRPSEFAMWEAVWEN